MRYDLPTAVKQPDPKGDFFLSDNWELRVETRLLLTQKSLEAQISSCEVGCPLILTDGQPCGKLFGKFQLFVLAEFVFPKVLPMSMSQFPDPTISVPPL